MSDIYLQISETPTVVTLMQPVIGAALTSTVTVANVVTVALDSNSLSALENVTVTVGAAVSISNFPATQPVSIASVTIGSLPLIAGTVTANLASVVTSDSFWGTEAIKVTGGSGYGIDIAGVDGSGNRAIFEEGGGIPVYPRDSGVSFPISGTVTVGNSVTIGSLPAISGTVTANNTNLNRLVQDTESNGAFGVPLAYARIAGGELDYFAEVNQEIGLPIRNDANPLVVSGTVTVGNSVTISSLPAISGTVTANTFALQGTAVTTSDFTSTTASTLLAGFNAGREVLTIFNEGAGNLHICPGATCTTIAYQVRLSSGDFYEVPNHQTTITHSAVFQTAGTARVTEVS